MERKKEKSHNGNLRRDLASTAGELRYLLGLESRIQWPQICNEETLDKEKRSSKKDLAEPTEDLIICRPSEILFPTTGRVI